MIGSRFPGETVRAIIAAPPAVTLTQACPRALTPLRTRNGLTFAENDAPASELGKKGAHFSIQSPDDAPQTLEVRP
jgi:hypothetical protein